MQKGWRYLGTLIMLMMCFCCGCSLKGKEKQPDNPEKVSKQEENVIETAYDSNYDAIGGEGLLFEVDEEKGEAAVISHYDVEMEELTLPDVILYEDKEYKVTSVGPEAFESNQALVNVTFGENIKKISKSAFYSCAVLSDITFSDALSIIGKDAFSECYLLQHITWGSGLEIVGDNAFRGDEALTELVLPASVTDWGVNTFMDCTGLEKVTFVDGATVVGDGIFTNCIYLAEVLLPESISTIGAEAFWGCMSLEQLEMPDSVVVIGDRAFYSTSITTLRMPASLSGVKMEILEGMDSLEEILVSEAKLDSYEEVFENYGIDIQTYEE